MAELGPAKLEGVNRLMRTIGEKPVAALDTGGTSQAAECERILDQVTRTVQETALEDNVQMCATLTASAGAVTLPATTLVVLSAGTSQHRHFKAKGDVLFDIDNWTAVFGASEVVQVKIAHAIAWADCSPVMKEKIIAEGELLMQRYWRGNPMKDQELQQQVGRVDGLAPRPLARPGGSPFPGTIPPFQPAQVGGQQGG